MASFLASRNYNLIYVNVPKSACTSIKNYLYFMDNGIYTEKPNNIHRRSKKEFITYRFDRDEMKRLFYTHFVFTFVRHPLRRAFSAFNEKILNLENGGFDPIRDHLTQTYNATITPDQNLEQFRANFAAFLRMIRDCERKKFRVVGDLHWLPQYRLIEEACRIRLIDFIGRVENFDADFQLILDRVKYDGKFEFIKFNEGTFNTYKYNEVINDEILELGGEIFRGDCLNFAYQIERTRTDA